MAIKKTRWVVYILQCGDGTLYTGITNNLQARIEKHRQGKGAKYTRGRGPYKVLFREPCPSRAAAQKREAAIKVLTKARKMAIIAKKPRKKG